MTRASIFPLVFWLCWPVTLPLLMLLAALAAALAEEPGEWEEENERK